MSTLNRFVAVKIYLQIDVDEELVLLVSPDTVMADFGCATETITHAFGTVAQVHLI